MTVKEQMPSRYADQMAKRGFAALAFDFTGWGESEGERRQFEDPAQKIEDIKAAVAFLKTLPEIDAQRIGGLAICASSGYLAHAAVDNPDIKAVAFVAPWLHDRELVEQVYGGAESVAKLIGAGRVADESYRQTGKQTFLLAASLTDRTAIMFGVPYYTETKRGLISAWRNEADPGFWEGWLTFDAISAAPKLTQPFFQVESEAAALPAGAHKFFAALKGEKGELWLPNTTQMDFYDQPEPVARASDAVAEHFRRHFFGDNTERVREFFTALEAADIPRFLKVWSEDGVQEMPFSPGSFPKRLEGKAAIDRQYSPLPANFSGMRFPIRRLLTTTEPGVVVAEYEGSIGLKSGGHYDNRYIGVFSFDAEGKLARFTEYFDPLILLAGFPGAAALGPDGPRLVLEAFPVLADKRDWEGLRACFADEVDFDYTSVAGGEPARVKADDLVAGWKAGLERYDHTKHNFSAPTVQIDGSAATATFTGQATHVHGDKRWSCGGDYEFKLTLTPQGWKVSAARFEMKWEQGER